MNLTNLLEEFNVVIDTPEGLTELRSLILGLAVRGKLVPQNSNDEPASELLKKIETEKQRLYEEGEIRNPKKFKEVPQSNIPFEIPTNWKWVKISNAGITQTGTTPKKTEKKYWDEDYKFIKPANIESGEVDYESEGVSAFAVDNGKARLIKKGSVLVVCIGTLGKTGFTKKNVSCNQQINAVTPYSGIYYKFLYHVLKSDVVQNQYLDRATSTTIVILNKGNWEKTLIPLPPLAEQHRIVQKIESLFAEVDELEEKLNRQTKLDEKLQMAVNAEVQQAPDAEASKSAWNFITSNFDTLYHTPEAIDNLKKNILNEAVRGRLVPQNPNDEPASELLKKIEAEKERLYQEGEIRKPKKLPPVKEDEIPFEIPENWQWSKINEIFEVGTGSTPSTSENKYYENGTIPWFTSSATNNLFTGKAEKVITEKALDETNCKIFPKGSLIIALYGQGKTRGQVSELTTEGATNQAIAALVSMYDNENESLKKYTKFFFLKIYTEIRELAEGGAQPNLNVGKIKKTIIPVPPLEEQHRIVQRIVELFAVCDRFKVQLQQRQGVNERLVKGLVGEVLEGS